MIDLVNISVPNAAGYAVLGYLVVFLGLVMLMLVIFLMGRIMTRKKAVPAAAPAAAAPAAAPAAVPVKADPAPGTAGEFKLYDTDPRAAAMCMAIVADTLGKPLNELRFISIREVKEDEV